MHIRFWGVRGSFPVPGSTTNRVGGNTSCVQVCPGYNGEPSSQMQELHHGASVLIHDCTYTGQDQQARRSRGQSSIEEAAHVAAMCQVKSLAMFHYDQDYTDQQVDRLRDRCREYLDHAPGGKAIELIAASEGLTLHTD